MADEKNTSPLPRPLQLGLAAHRLRRGVRLESIAESTRIAVRFLQAIEDEEFARLPGGAYSTGYIRQYAAATGFDPEELLECYYSKMGLSQNGEPSQQSRRIGPGKEGVAGWGRVIRPIRFS
jgi:cytoskeletal protein RodZ